MQAASHSANSLEHPGIGYTLDPRRSHERLDKTRRGFGSPLFSSSVTRAHVSPAQRF